MMRTYFFIGYFVYLGQLHFSQVLASASAAPKSTPYLADEGSGDDPYGYHNYRYPIDDDEDYREGSAESIHPKGIYDNIHEYDDIDYEDDYDYTDTNHDNNYSTSTTESYRDYRYDPYEKFGNEVTHERVESSGTSTTTTTTTTTTPTPPPLVVPSEDVTSDFNIVEHDHFYENTHDPGHDHHEHDHHAHGAEVVTSSSHNPDRTVPKYSPEQDYRWYDREEDNKVEVKENEPEHHYGSGYGPHSSVPGRDDDEDEYPDEVEDDFFVPPADFERTAVVEDDISIDSRPPVVYSPPASPPSQVPPMSITPEETLPEETHKDMDTSIRILTQKDVERQVSIFAQPGILAAFIGGAVIGLLCAILLVMFIVYRMRKRDEGSYPLDEPKRMPLTSSYAPNDKEIYA